MIQTKPLTGQCPHCGAPAERLAYQSRYTMRGGQTVYVIRCREGLKGFARRLSLASRAFIRPPFNAGLIAVSPENLIPP